MPLTENEKVGLMAIIGYLSTEDVFSLAKTVVNNLVGFENEQEAISAILSYTPNPMDFFKRKKIKKELIFKYAHKMGIPNITPSLCRLDLVKAVLTFWGSNCTVEQMDDSDWNDTDSGTLCIPNQQNYFGQPTSNGFNAFPQPQQLINEQNSQMPNSITNFYNDNSNNTNSNNNSTHSRSNDAFNCWLDRNLMPSLEDQQLALEFCRWYYPILNSFATNRDAVIDTSPYFPNCSLHFLVKSAAGINSEICEGSQIVVEKLKAFISREQINFNPNLSEKGLKCLSDRFGRKAVMVAGTIHQGSNVGLFEQQLGLVRDPGAEYNWKIIFSRLAITNFLHNQEPILENTQLLLNL